MKHSLRGAIGILLAISPVAHLACGSDDASTPSTPLDGGSTGLDGGNTGPVTDGTTDASPTAVTVTAVNALKAPKQGVSIVFYDNAGAVLATATTDANGRASQEMPAGGQVTAAFGTADNPHLVTIVGAETGDALTMLDPTPLFDQVTFKVTAPATAFPNTDHLELVLGTCKSNIAANTNTSDPFDGFCIDQVHGLGTLVLEAMNASNMPIATTSLSGFTLTDHQVNNVTFANAWTATGAAETVTVTGLPASAPVSGGPAQVGITHAHGAGNDFVAQASVKPLGSASGGSLGPISFTNELGGAAFHQNEVALTVAQSAAPFAVVRQAIATRGAVAASASLAYDAPLPAITSSTATGTTTPTVTWQSAAALTSTKAIVVEVGWGTTNGTGSWLVVSPPSATTVTPPALPAALASFGPQSTTKYDETPLVLAVDGTLLTSYAAARAAAALLTPSAGLESGDTGMLVPALPADGTLKLTVISRAIN